MIDNEGKIHFVMRWTLRPYMVCRAALIETDWDMHAAIMNLRYEYLAKVIVGEVA